MPAETWAHEPAWWTVKYGPTVEALIQATWREIASVGAYVLAVEHKHRLTRMRNYAREYCDCEQDKACKYHEMWQAGEGPGR